MAKDEFILVEDEELEALQVESTRTIEIDKFVPRAQIDLRYLDSPYYIVLMPHPAYRRAKLFPQYRHFL